MAIGANCRRLTQAQLFGVDLTDLLALIGASLGLAAVTAIDDRATCRARRATLPLLMSYLTALAKGKLETWKPVGYAVHQ